MERDPGFLQCWLPYIQAEPVAWDMAIRVEVPGLRRPVLTCRAAVGSVDRVRRPAMLTPAPTRRVATESAVLVAATRGVRLGEAKRARVRRTPEPGRREGLLVGGEQQVIAAELMGRDVGDQLADEPLAEFEPAIFLVLGVGLDQESQTIWVELRVDLHHRPADRQYPGPGVKVLYPAFRQLSPPEHALDVGLDKQLRVRGGKRLVDRIELLGRDDLQR